MQLKSLLWAFVAATAVFASAVPEDAEKRNYYGAPATVTKWATKYKTKTTTCTKWSKTRTITKTKTTTRWSKTSTKWATKTNTRTVTKTITKPVATRTVTTTKWSTTTRLSTTTKVSTVTTTETSAPCSTSAPSGPRFAGCYKQNPENAPMLSQQPISNSTTLTPAICKDNCFKNGYPLAGLINGNSCACGEVIEDSWSETLDDDGCLTPCTGDSSVPCGGDNAFEIYVNAVSPKDIGCYDDNGSRSVLTDAYYTNPKMTTELCQTTCFSQDFTFAALRDGNRCYCNDGFINPPITKATDADCKTPCAGDDTGFDTCGGDGYLKVWALTN